MTSTFFYCNKKKVEQQSIFGFLDYFFFNLRGCKRIEKVEQLNFLVTSLYSSMFNYLVLLSGFLYFEDLVLIKL